MDSTNIDQLTNAEFQKAQKTKYKKLFNLALEKHNQQKAKLKTLFEQLKKEENDVEELEKISFVSLYHSFTGDKKDKLHQEKQEVLAVKLNFDSCQNQINSLKQEMAYYEDEIEKINKLQNNLNLSIVEENPLEESAVIQNRVQSQSIKAEIYQAIAAGKRVTESLDEAISSLKSAKGWGLFDMFAGGLVVSLVKHSKINTSKQKIEQLNILLDKFRRELMDVNELSVEKLQVDIHGFAKFADIFLDGIIFDWIVQSNMNKTMNALESTQLVTQKIMVKLKNELQRIN